MIEDEWQTEDRSGMQGGALRLSSPFAYYVVAQRGIGASRTSAYYAVAPVVGVLLLWVLFGAGRTPVFLVALVLMALGSWLSLPA